jgi:hypothetical protein
MNILFLLQKNPCNVQNANQYLDAANKSCNSDKQIKGL